MPENLTAPEHLSEERQAWWLQMMTEWDLGTHQVELLTMAAESIDLANMARRVLDEEGLTQPGRQGQVVVRPEVIIERDNKRLYKDLMKQLGIGKEPPKKRGRQDGTGGKEEMYGF